MFFAFFGYFFIGRLNLSKRDEAYLENERKASHASLILALLAFFYSIKLYLLERV